VSDEAQAYEGGAKCSVSIWTTARGGPQWRVRLTEEADDELAELVVGRAVRAYGRVEAELAVATRPAFTGEEPHGA
jgi:hypothetical protein